MMGKLRANITEAEAAVQAKIAELARLEVWPRAPACKATMPLAV